MASRVCVLTTGTRAARSYLRSAAVKAGLSGFQSAGSIISKLQKKLAVFRCIRIIRLVGGRVTMPDHLAVLKRCRDEVAWIELRRSVEDCQECPKWTDLRLIAADCRMTKWNIAP
jgi:hypothetical protein